MAQAQDGRKKRPRIRKSATTIREKVEAATAKTEQQEPGVTKKALSKATSPFRRLRLRDRRLFKVLAKPFVFLKRPLAWLAPKYLLNSWRELRQVVWPSRRETWRLTLAVFVFAVIFGALVAGVDKSLDELFKKVVLK